MRIAGLITVFNGLELLPSCVENLRRQVDVIIIAYQQTSNKGEYCNVVKSLCESFEDVFTIEFEPITSASTKENERIKHNQLIDEAKRFDCTHFVLLATDHFYTDKDFQYGKRQVIENDYDVTFTPMYTYYKYANWRLDPIEEYFMPFICKIHPNTKVKEVKNYPLYVDPSIQVNTFANWWLFDIKEVALHHYSKVRNDIENKYRNAAASVNWNKEKVDTFLKEYKEAKVGDKISYFQGREIIEVDDIFNLNKEINI